MKQNKEIHQKEMQIIKILIDSELSNYNQLKVIKNIKERLDFCKNAALEMKQIKLDL